MRKRTRLFSIVLAILVVIAMMPSAVMAADTDPEPAGPEYAGKTVVLYTANVKGDIDTYATVAALKADYASKGASVILADAGNFLQGSVYANYDRGLSIVNLMDETGYDVAALGRSEFYFGDATTGTRYHKDLKSYYTLKQLFYGADDTHEMGAKEAADVKAVSSNIEGENPYYQFENSCAVTTGDDDSVKIGFIALTDPQTPDAVLENNVEGLNFLKETAMTEAAAKYAAALKDDGCSTVICLSNAGETAVSDVDYVISPEGNETEIGAIAIDSEGNIENLNPDKNIDTSSNPVSSSIDSIKSAASGVEAAENNVVLEGSEKSVRSLETNTGDLWTDALVWYAKSSNTFTRSFKNNGVSQDNVIALWNGGNLRDYIQPGAVTKADIERTLPYPNTIAVVYVKGSDLLYALESGTQGLPYTAETGDACAAFPHVSGIEYAVKTFTPYDKGDAYGNCWFKANTIRRVSISSVNGKAFDKNATYAVITSNAIYNGMDAYYPFKESKLDASFIGSKKVTDIVWNYIQTVLDGTIDDQYAQQQNRIMIYNEPQTISSSYSTVTKVYGNKAFSLGAKSDKGASLKYKSGNTAVATVSSGGTVTIKGIGTAKITVSAAGKNGSYAPASKTITVKVNPKTASGIKLSSKSKKITVKWSKDTKVTGYQISIQSKKSVQKVTKTVSSYKTTSFTTKSSYTKGKKYYVSVREYKVVNGVPYYGKWSSPKYITVK